MSEAAKLTAIWEGHLIKTITGKPKPVLANVMIVLREHPQWRGALCFDAFANRIELRTPAPWESVMRKNNLWTNTDTTLAAEHLQHLGLSVPSRLVGEAVNAVARESSFHPVQDYLASLVWDMKPRLDTWLVDYLGASADEDEQDRANYLAAVGAKWMISAVARVTQPGTKADHMPIFEGQQGTLKSTMLRVLCDPWFTDELAEFGTKDSGMQLCGVWCVEIAELEGLRRAEKERIKAFITRTTDRFRPPYSALVETFPRQCVFAGTANGSEYFKDETGNRRFWPVACGTINIASLRRDRDQLWAEAAARYETGETWWLQDWAVIKAAQREQADRFSDDPWRPRIERFIRDRVEVTTYEILKNALTIEDSKMNRQDQMRVGSVLIALGWAPRQVRRDGGRTRVYRRKPDTQ